MRFILFLFIATQPFNTALAVDPSWYDTDFHARLQTELYIPSVGNGDTVPSWPVALFLDTDTINWSLVDRSGDDLLFIDERTGFPLDYEIDDWRPNNTDKALIWIRAVDINAGDNIPITLYYDNDNIASPASDSEETFRDFVLVHHMQAPFIDSTLRGNDGVLKNTATEVQGVLGNAIEFDGGYLGFSTDIGAIFGTEFYLSYWTEAYSGDSDLDFSPGILGSLDAIFSSNPDAFALGLVDNSLDTFLYEKGYTINSGNLFNMSHIAFSWKANDSMTSFYDGRLYDDNLTSSNSLLQVQGIGIISRPSPFETDSYYTGIIDELRVYPHKVTGELIPRLDYESGRGTLFDQCARGTPCNEYPMGLSMTQSVQPSSYSSVGEVLTFNSTIKNTGFVELYIAGIAQSTLGFIYSCNTPQIDFILTPSATADCTASYSITQDDMDRDM